MSIDKKYSYQIEQEENGWSAKIVRRASAKKTVVSKRQSGFSTESEAQKWGKDELKSFLENLAQRNERDALKRRSHDEEAKK